MIVGIKNLYCQGHQLSVITSQMWMRSIQWMLDTGSVASNACQNWALYFVVLSATVSVMKRNIETSEA